ncbi:MAG: BamA/TamA family outer membrane protein [Luteolibacter sp.]|uniref:BamA/OMP85 family outer membrane protein n=1 Tax=Luteolibacter sp. TaxID=1962973 RepID=UPI0032652F76
MNSCRTTLVLLLTALAASAETRVIIEGMKRKSGDQVLGLMGGRLEHVRKSDASASRADDAAFLVRQVLQKDGYADVQVNWKIVSSTEILLTVQEGKRLSLGTVTVNGVPKEDTRKFVKLYSRPAEKDRPLTAGDAPFREEDVATGLSYIQQELNAEGYWAAEAEISSRETDPATGSVSVVIDVKQGEQFRIAPARITSSDEGGLRRTKVTVEPYIGRWATTGNLNAMRLAVEESFTSSGYPDSNITMSRSLEQARFIPQFSVELGKRVKLNKVHPEGLVITNPARIEARMKALEGQWYDEAAMNKRIRELLATGAFSSVRLERYPVSEDRIDATLHLEEGRARQLSFAAGADSYQGPIFRTTYADRNLWGELLGFSSGFEFSSKGILGETKLIDPWMFGNDVAGTLRAYALSFTREGYSSLETGLEASTKWKVGDHYTLDLLGGYSIVNLSANGLPSDELGETVYTHPRLRFTQTLDYRDSPVLPTSGWHLEAPVEIGAAVGTVSTRYASAGMSGGWYHKLGSKYDLVLGGACGVIIPTGDGEGLPIDIRLFNGGSGSVRSFPDRELGPVANTYPTGGEASWHTNAELIRTISGSVKGVAFFDAGSLSRQYDDIPDAKLNLAAGLGIRLDLPIGPIRLEYGYNLTQDPGEPIGTLHFAIGTAF